MLVLLDLSAAFDIIDHDNLFFTLEKYVGFFSFYRMMLVLLLFMHLLVVDYIIVIIFCTMFHEVKLIDYKDFRINLRVS